MKSKILIKAFALLIIVGALSSCNKELLNVRDANSYNYETYFNTPAEIQQGSTAIYVAFYNNNMMGFEWPEIFDALANEASPTLAALANEISVAAIYQFQHVNTNSTIEKFWKMLYKIVLRSNLVLAKGAEYIAKNGENASVSQSMGEAYFLRGYAYSQLAFFWGRVPIRTTFDQGDNINAPRSATVKEVWDVAEADFKLAQTLLPVSWDATNVGRATKGAATGFLGKLYLYNERWTEADAQFATMDADYNLLPGNQWEDNFGERNKNNIESVFAVQFQWFEGNWLFGPLGQPEGFNNQPSTHSAHQQLYGWNDWGNWFFPTRRVADFVYNDEAGNSYEDPRADLTFYGGIGDNTWQDHAPGGPVPYDFAALGYWYKKILNKEYKPTESNLQSANNLSLMRYADVLLMRAEAKLRSGDIPGCMTLINRVRTRIGAFTYAGTYNEDQAFGLLMRERQLELMGEQTRYPDLLRWGLMAEVMNVETQATFGQPRVLSKHLLFPIPLSEIDTNIGLGDVNSDWN